jgi:hypothetical protein
VQLLGEFKSIYTFGITFSATTLSVIPAIYKHRRIRHKAADNTTSNRMHIRQSIISVSRNKLFQASDPCKITGPILSYTLLLILPWLPLLFFFCRPMRMSKVKAFAKRRSNKLLIGRQDRNDLSTPAQSSRSSTRCKYVSASEGSRNESHGNTFNIKLEPPNQGCQHGRKGLLYWQRMRRYAPAVAPAFRGEISINRRTDTRETRSSASSYFPS